MLGCPAFLSVPAMGVLKQGWHVWLCLPLPSKTSLLTNMADYSSCSTQRIAFHHVDTPCSHTRYSPIQVSVLRRMSIRLWWWATLEIREWQNLEVLQLAFLLRYDCRLEQNLFFSIMTVDLNNRTSDCGTRDLALCNLSSYARMQRNNDSISA